jgi:hypothetical protein
MDCITVEDLCPHPTSRETDPVIVQWNGCEVTDRKERVQGLRHAADETEDNIAGIPIVDPFKPLRIKISFVEGIFFPVYPV